MCIRDSLSSGQPPEGYRFALRCEDGMVSITQDGRELDVYGDGWYTEDDLWFVPGYENFPMDADARNIQVYLAAASDPKPMVYGNYLGSGADICTSQLYDLVQNLAQYRRELLTEWGMLGGGVLLLALALVLRRDKARADRFLARGTGRIWFEVKVLLALLALLLLPWGELSGWIASTPTSAYAAASSTVSSGSAQWDTGAVALYSYSGDVVQSQAKPMCMERGKGRTCSSISFRRWAPVPPPLFWPSWLCTCWYSTTCGTTGRHGGTECWGCWPPGSWSSLSRSGSAAPPAWSPCPVCC